MEDGDGAGGLSKALRKTAYFPIAREFEAVKLQATKLSLNVHKPQSFTDPPLVEDTGTVVGDGSNYSQHVQEYDLIPEQKQASDFGLNKSKRVVKPLSCK